MEKQLSWKLTKIISDLSQLHHSAMFAITVEHTQHKNLIFILLSLLFFSYITLSYLTYHEKWIVTETKVSAMVPVNELNK